MPPPSDIHEDHYCATCNASQGLSAMGHHQKRAACRYYQAGNCRRGPSCPFAHVSITPQIESPTIPHPAYLAGDHVYTYYPLGQTPVYHPVSSPVQPVFLWQPYGPLSPSFDPRYGLVCQTENHADFPDDKSDPSSAESSSTTASADHRPRMTLDTGWFEGVESETPQGVASPPGDFGANLSPGYTSYNYPVLPGVQTECVVGGDRATSGQVAEGSMVALPSQFLLPWQDDPRRKPLAYKTKPCKFYTANGKCTSGEKCTFIHDPESKGNATRPPPKPAPPTHAKLPPKPLNKYDDFRARDFYPITWRVIGGGVMMGGQRQICPAFAAGQCKYGDDCRLAHETELGTDSVGFVEPKYEGDASLLQPVQGTMPKRVRSSLPRKSSRVSPTEVPQPVNFPLTTTPRSQRPDVPALKGMGAARKEGDEVVVTSAPASPVHRRTRSMSMVTSPSPPDTTQSNYAAEL